MSNEEILKLLKKAVDNNVICYDVDAKIGESTPRLISIMKTIFKEHENLFESSDDELELFISDKILCGKSQVQKMKCTLDLTTECLKLMVTFPSNKNNIVIGVGKNGGVILGCY